MKTSIKYIGFVESKEWSHFAWVVEINGERFDYKTGIGHGTPKHGKGKGVKQTVYESEKPNKRPIGSVDAGEYWANTPKIDDILHCLFLDSQAGNESFDEFCDNSGYSNDSLKALDAYRACMDTAKRLRKALGVEYESEKARIEALDL